MLTAVRALIRFFSLALSFAFSTFAAAILVTFALFLGGDPAWLQDDLGVWFGATAFLGVAWFTIAQLSFTPALVLFLLLELGRISSLLLHVLAGGLCAAIILALYPYATGLEGNIVYPGRQIWLTGLSAGFVGGLTHWAITGHRSGRWMGIPKESHPEATTPMSTEPGKLGRKPHG